MRFQKFVWVFVFLCLCGCSFFSRPAKLSSDKILPVPSGKILDEIRLSRGGKVAIISFKAGPNVEANEELDKASLMMTRGLADMIENSDGSLKVVFDDEVNLADFLLEGYITEMTTPGKLKRWVMQNRKREISVKGKLLDRKSNKIIAVFTDHKSSKDKTRDFRQMGLEIGQDIGKFLVNK